MRRVIVESPYAGDIEANLAYARAAMLDCLRRHEAPMASHCLYTQPGLLDDAVAEERALGIAAGLSWGIVADATVVYVDRGLSAGMREGIRAAHAANRPVEFRSLESLREIRVSNIQAIFSALIKGVYTSDR